MSASVIVIVLCAALLHATWNFLVKRSADTYQGMSSVVLGHIPFGLVALFFVPAVSSSALMYIASGAVLHTGYQLFLLNSYRFGDLSQVYPMARGGAPFIVALVSVLFLGVSYDRFELAALVVIGVGIVSLAFTGGRSGGKNSYVSSILAIFTCCFIAAYSLVDGLGAREAGTSLGYYSWVTIINGVIFGAVMCRLRPGVVGGVFTRCLPITLLGGGASFFAYALVVWAFTQAPIALVTSLRETSIIFALCIGVFVLKERMNYLKGIAVLLTLTGIGLLRLGAYL
jgi:drug/metabolite transporter (DMT)-like permease